MLWVDTQSHLPGGFSRDRTQPRRIYIPGIQYKPIPNVVLKLDYRGVDSFEGSAANELSFGFGLVF